MQPVPMARARAQRGRGRPYTPAHVRDAKAEVTLKTQPYRGAFPQGAPVTVELTFDCARWRGDMDNLEKLVLDAVKATGGGSGVIHDDRQVRRKLTEVRYGMHPEGVHLVVYPYHT